MRSHHILSIMAILTAGIALKWLLFAKPAAVAQPEASGIATMDVFQMQRDSKDLPVLEIKDPI